MGNRLNGAGRFAVLWRSALFGVAAVVFAGSPMAQAPIAAYGYVRATLPGIPGMAAGDQNLRPGQEAFAPKYRIFVAVKSGSRVAAKWAWVRDKAYDCALSKVRTPVIVDRDVAVKTDKKETLVPKTSDDVYEIVLRAPRPQTELSAQEQMLASGNEAVVALVLDNAPAYATVRSLVALPPAAAM
jgi:hypothetical protein